MVISFLLCLVSPRIDPSAVALLRRVQNRLTSLRTLSGVATRAVTHTRHKPDESSVIVNVTHFKLMKPRSWRLDTSLDYREFGKTGWTRLPAWRTDASDGRIQWSVDHRANEYRTGETTSFPVKDLMPLFGITGQGDSIVERIKLLKNEDLLRSLDLVGWKRWNGVSCRVVRLRYQQVGSKDIVTEDHFVGGDFIVRHIDVDWSTDDRHTTFDLTMLKVNSKLTPSAFAYRPPAGYHVAKDVPLVESRVLAVGSLAPDFTVQDQKGRSVHLSDFRGKTIVLDFWATWCANCLPTFPGINGLARQYKNRVVFLMADVGDTPKVFRDWVKRNGQFDALVFVLDPAGISGGGVDSKLYKVSGLPTVFVIDGSGVVKASFVGNDGQGEAKLEQAVKSVRSGSR